MKSARRTAIRALTAVGAMSGLAGSAGADLLLYDPFDYTAGSALGGTDPDGAGPTPGTSVGQTNTYTGGGTWHARGSTADYQQPNDTVVSAGSLSYAGLAPSIGNSVSYGTSVNSSANLALLADSIDIPGPDITSGPLYASFIIRIKSNPTILRHNPVSFVSDTTPPTTLGSALSGQVGGTVAYPGGFWMRKDPTVLDVTNFSPSKSNTDGIGPGADGPSAGWQTTNNAMIESNQFGAVNGQAAPDLGNPGSWQTYFVVLKYNFDTFATPVNLQNDTVSLWMNPGSGTLGQASGESLASQAASGDLGSYYAAVNAFGTGALDATAIRSFALIGHRQNTQESMAVDFDELRIGTTWADVTPAGAQTYHWDIDGNTAAGAGGATPSGNWDGSTQNFNTSSVGGPGGTLVANPATTDTVVFSAGSDATGVYTVNVAGTRTVAALKFEDGTAILSGGTLAANSYEVAPGASGAIFSAVSGSVTKKGAGTLVITSNNSYTGGTTVEAGTLIVNRLHGLAADGTGTPNPVSITGGTLQVAESAPTIASGHPGGNNAFVSRPGSMITIANNGGDIVSLNPATLTPRIYNGKLNLTNNDLVIDYSGASPIADIEDMIRAGRNGGNWLGNGITSSTAGSIAAAGAYTLGVIDNATPGITPFTTFSGQTVDTTTVLVKFVHRSDINMDGVVTFSDSVRFNGNYSEGTPTRWVFGDLNYNGISDFGDSVLFNGGYDEALASLPEPGTASAMGLIGLALARRRRLRR